MWKKGGRVGRYGEEGAHDQICVFSLFNPTNRPTLPQSTENVGVSSASRKAPSAGPSEPCCIPGFGQGESSTQPRDQEFQVILSGTVSSRTDWLPETLSLNNNNNKKVVVVVAQLGGNAEEEAAGGS